MLYVCCGLPRCGKSTFSKNWSKISNRVVINSDNIRLALTGQRFNPNIESVVSTMKDTFIKTMLLGKYDILVDGTHTSFSSVRKIESYVPESELVWIIFNTPVDVCISRAKQTGQEDLVPVIQKMDNQLSEVSEYLLSKYSGLGHMEIGSDRVENVSLIKKGQKLSLSYTNDIDYIREQNTSLLAINYR